MKKQRFFKIALLASFFVMIFASWASAANYIVNHWVKPSTQYNSMLGTGDGAYNTSYTLSEDRYILLYKNKEAEVTVSLDLGAPAFGSVDVTWTLDTNDGGYGKINKSTTEAKTVIASGDRLSTVTLLIKPTATTDKTFIRVIPTFEGQVVTTVDGTNKAVSVSTLTAGNGFSYASEKYLSKGSADVYFKSIDKPTFTIKDLSLFDGKGIPTANATYVPDVDDPEATTPVVTARGVYQTGSDTKVTHYLYEPFKFGVYAGEAINEVPTIDSKIAALAKEYNVTITVSKDRTVKKTEDGTTITLKSDNAPDLAYWFIVSGDGSVSTPSSGIELKFTAKNIAGKTDKTVKLVIPANANTIAPKVMNATWSKKSETSTTYPTNGLFGENSKDVAIGSDVGTINLSVDMNLPIDWTCNLPDGLTLTVNKDEHTATIKGKVTTEQSFTKDDLWVTATNRNDSEKTTTLTFLTRDLNIGAVPKFDTTAPAELTTGTPYTTTISLTNGTAKLFDVLIYSNDVADANKVADYLKEKANDTSAKQFYFSITSADDNKSIIINSSDDQKLRYVNAKKKYIVRVTASNDLGAVSKDFTINVTPTAPAWVEGSLPSTADVGKALADTSLKFSGALPMVLSLDITPDTKNNPGITNVSKDLGLKYAIDKSGGTNYEQIFSDDILVVSSDGFRNGAKKLKVNVIAKNIAMTTPTSIKTFTMDVVGTAPEFSADQDLTIYVKPNVTLNNDAFVGTIAGVNSDSGVNYSVDIANWNAIVKGTGPLTVTAKGQKSPVTYADASQDLYGSAFDDEETNDNHGIVSGKYIGVLGGKAPAKGKQTITLTAQNTAGKATRKINLMVVDDPVISTKKDLKKLTVGKAYKAAFKSKAKNVTWELVNYNGTTENAAGALLTATGLSFDAAGTLEGTMEAFPAGASSIDLKVAAVNQLGVRVSQDFRIPLTIAKPKLTIKGKIPDLYVGDEFSTENIEGFTFTADSGAFTNEAISHDLAQYGLTIAENEDARSGTTRSYIISGTASAATIDAKSKKAKAAKATITVTDLAGQTAKKNINVFIHNQPVELDESYDAGSIGNNETKGVTVDLVELGGEGNQTYKWSIKAAKGEPKVKGLKAAVAAKAKKGLKDNEVLQVVFTTKKAEAGTGVFTLIGKNAGDSKITVSADVTVSVTADEDTAEALKDNAEALKDAAEGNEATEATESTSKTETEAADAADAKAEAGITVGGARGESSLTANEKKALEGYVIAAVLPEVTVTEDGQYDIEDVQLKEEIPAGAKLEWFAFPRSASKGDEDIVDFTDNSGAYTEVVPEDHVVTVSPWFNADVVYAPVIAVKADEVNDDDEAKTEE